MNYVLLSVIFAALVLPVLFSNDPRPRRGLRRAVVAVLAFNTLYLLVLHLSHSRPPG